jgi:hypothetical protein
LKKQIAVWMVALFAALTGVRGQSGAVSGTTSYLLVQGPFGASNAEETFKWEVNYQAGDLQTGQNLLNVVFGVPIFSGSDYTDLYGDTYPYWTSGNSTQGAGYIYYPQFGQFLLASITLDSVTVLQDPSYSPGWNYYVAGGGSNYGDGYANNGSWTYSADGLGSRSLTPPDAASDGSSQPGSFDGWVFGDTDYGATSTIDNGTVGGTNDDGSASSGINAPFVANFADATLIDVPEPGSAVLLILGAGGMLLLCKRQCAQS